MKFSVLWMPSAERHVTSLWLDAIDRDVIASAVNSIDTLLATDAHTRGEPRSEDKRILFVEPLGIEFKVSLPDRQVYVLAVWRFNQRGK